MMIKKKNDKKYACCLTADSILISASDSPKDSGSQCVFANAVAVFIRRVLGLPFPSL